MATCVGWETEPIATVWTSVAERNRVELDFTQTKKLQTAQLMFSKQGGPQNPGQKWWFNQNNNEK